MLTQWFAELPARKSLHWDQGVSAKLLSSLPRVLQALSQASHALPSILTPCSLSRMESYIVIYPARQAQHLAHQAQHQAHQAQHLAHQAQHQAHQAQHLALCVPGVCLLCTWSSPAARHEVWAT